MRARPFHLPLLALALAGCGATNYASVEFAGLCTPPSPQAIAPACLYLNTCQSFWGQGRLAADVARPEIQANGLVWPVQVNDQLANNAATVGSNTNDATVQEVHLQYQLTYPSGGTSVVQPVPDATWSQTFVVPAAGSASPLLTVIDPVTAAGIATALSGKLASGVYAQLIVQLRASGHFASGDAFETGSIQIPVDVCSGCLGTATPTCTTVGATYLCCPQYGQSSACMCQVLIQ